MINLHATVALSRRAVRIFYRNPLVSGFYVLMPLMLVLFVSLALEPLYETPACLGISERIAPSVYEQTVPGFTLLLSGFIAVTLATQIATERERGTWQRFLQAPIPGWMPLIVLALVALSLVLVQTAVLFLVGWAVFGMELGEQYPALILTIVLFQVIPISLGMFVASVTSDMTLQSNMLTPTVLLMAIVGGAVVPLFVFPGWMQVVARFTPHFWAMDSLHGIMFRGDSLGDVVLNLIVLAGVGAALVFVSLARFARKEVPWS